MCIVASFIITNNWKNKMLSTVNVKLWQYPYWNTTQSTTDTYPYLNDFQGNYAE